MSGKGKDKSKGKIKEKSKGKIKEKSKGKIKEKSKEKSKGKSKKTVSATQNTLNIYYSSESEVPFNVEKDDPITFFEEIKKHCEGERTRVWVGYDDFIEDLGETIVKYEKLSETYGEDNIKALFWNSINRIIRASPQANPQKPVFNQLGLSNFNKSIDDAITKQKMRTVKITFEGRELYEGQLSINGNDNCWTIYRKMLDKFEQSQKLDERLRSIDVRLAVLEKFGQVQGDDQKIIIDEVCNDLKKDIGKQFAEENAGEITIKYDGMDEIVQYIDKFEHKSSTSSTVISIKNAVIEYKLKNKLKNAFGYDFTFSHSLEPKLLDYLDKMYVIDEEKYKQIEGFPNSPTEENTKDHNMEKLYTRKDELSAVLINFNPYYIDHLDEISFLEFDKDYNITPRKTLIPLIMPVE